MRVYKIVQTLMDTKCSIIIMTSSDYGPVSINKLKKYLNISCENDFSIFLTVRSHVVLKQINSYTKKLYVKSVLNTSSTSKKLNDKTKYLYLQYYIKGICR